MPQHLVGALGVGGDAVYSSRIMARAKNMRAGGHVLQLRVQKSGMSDWWICASVGASMRITTYNCYLLVRENREAGVRLSQWVRGGCGGVDNRRI